MTDAYVYSPKAAIDRVPNASYVEHDASYSREIMLTIFHLIILNDVSLGFKINGNFRHNHITILDFTAT